MVIISSKKYKCQQASLKSVCQVTRIQNGWSLPCQRLASSHNPTLHLLQAKSKICYTCPIYAMCFNYNSFWRHFDFVLSPQRILMHFKPGFWVNFCICVSICSNVFFYEIGYFVYMCILIQIEIFLNRFILILRTNCMLHINYLIMLRMQDVKWTVTVGLCFLNTWIHHIICLDFILFFIIKLCFTFNMLTYYENFHKIHYWIFI